MIQYICYFCNKEFFDKPSKKRNFCSVRCRCNNDGKTKTNMMFKVNIGKHRSDETKEKIRQAHLGKPKHFSNEYKAILRERIIDASKSCNTESYVKMVQTKKQRGNNFHTEESKRLMSKQRIGKSFIRILGKEREEERRLKISQALKGRPKPEGFGEKVRQKVKGNQNKLGWKMPEEVKKKIGDSNRGKKYSKEIVEAMRIRALKFWNDLSEEQKQDHITKVLTAEYPFPTSLEQHCINIFKEYNVPLIYTGNGMLGDKKFAIAGCYPDFVDLQEKIVVEVYACFHKIKQYGSIEAYQEKRLKRMKGWKVYFFDENEVFSKSFLDNIMSIFEKPIEVNK